MLDRCTSISYNAHKIIVHKIEVHRQCMMPEDTFASI